MLPRKNVLDLNFPSTESFPGLSSFSNRIWARFQELGLENFPSLSNSYRFFKSLSVLLNTMRTALDPRLTLDDGDTIFSFEFSDSF